MAVWTLLALPLTGVGLCMGHAFRRRLWEFADLLLAPWLRWGAMVAVHQAWNLFFPVNVAAPLLTAGGGILGLVAHRNRLGKLLAGNRPALMVWAVGLAAVALWLAHHALKQPGWYDSGPYHLNARRWARLHPVFPSLADFHGDWHSTTPPFSTPPCAMWGILPIDRIKWRRIFSSCSWR